MSARILTVRQPWAGLLVHGLKTIEVRSWTTKYRGPLLIHAAKALDRYGLSRFNITAPLAAIIGLVQLADVRPFTPEMWRNLAEEHLQHGTMDSDLFAWTVTEPLVLTEPIPCLGKLGLWQDEALAKAALKRLSVPA